MSSSTVCILHTIPFTQCVCMYVSGFEEEGGFDQERGGLESSKEVMGRILKGLNPRVYPMSIHVGQSGSKRNVELLSMECMLWSGMPMKKCRIVAVDGCIGCGVVN